MTEDPKRKASETEPVDLGATGEEGVSPEAAGGDERQRLESEAAEMKDRFLRTLAEMENLRRRTEREVRDARQYAIAGFAREILAVADNLRRALEATPAEALAEGPMATLIDGLGLTERELQKVLEKHGVRRIEAQGARFDPNFHQAMFEVPDPSVPSGTVVQVMQEGYAIGERVLRPALVAVAKGGPKREAEPAAEPSAAADPTVEEPDADQVDRAV